MKRFILAGAFFMVVASSASAQLLSSIFDQQDTKKKDMAEQIALIETDLSEVKNGYKVTENGLTTIHDLKNGTFTLHTDYFSSLVQINPAIAKNPKVKAITDNQQQIIAAFEQAIQWQKQQAILTSPEMAYLIAVYSNMSKLCSNDITELTDVITPGKLQMKDEERLKRIDAIYFDMQDKYAFSRSFVQKMYALAMNRKQQQHESQVLKQFYNSN
ncbi:MAG: hypothetical protein JST19_06665 [Bacteroidetes bacterium]|nr:hypothetical protein [Bacteroidota bacterium]